MTDDEVASGPEMPDDWDDYAGWEVFHAGRLQRGDEIEANEGRFAGDLDELGFRRVWFPGCGLSGGAALYAARGFVVQATDVSATATAWQANFARNGLPKDQLKRLLARSHARPRTPRRGLSVSAETTRRHLERDNGFEP